MTGNRQGGCAGRRRESARVRRGAVPWASYSCALPTGRRRARAAAAAAAAEGAGTAAGGTQGVIPAWCSSISVGLAAAMLQPGVRAVTARWAGRRTAWTGLVLTACPRVCMCVLAFARVLCGTCAGVYTRTRGVCMYVYVFARGAACSRPRAYFIAHVRVPTCAHGIFTCTCVCVWRSRQQLGDVRALEGRVDVLRQHDLRRRRFLAGVVNFPQLSRPPSVSGTCGHPRTRTRACMHA